MRIDEGVGIWPNPTEGSWTRSLKFQSSMLCVREIVNFCFTDRAAWECCWTSVWVRRKGRKLKFCTLTCFSVCNLKKLMETGEENWHGWNFFFSISCVCDIENFCFIHEWRLERKIEMVRKKRKRKNQTETKLLDFACLWYWKFLFHTWEYFLKLCCMLGGLRRIMKKQINES